MNSKDGGPAYPQPIGGDNEMGLHTSCEKHPAFGMTGRQYYKAVAMAALLSDTRIDITPEDLVSQAARYADLIVAEDEAHERLLEGEK